MIKSGELENSDIVLLALVIRICYHVTIAIRLYNKCCPLSYPTYYI